MKRLLIVLILLLPPQVWGETLYVRPNEGTYVPASDGLTYSTAFDGFSDIVWGAGAGSLGAGDTLVVCTDATYTAFTSESLTIGGSGSAGNPITITGDCTSAGGLNGVISGGTLVTGWTDDGDGTYSLGSIASGGADGLFEDSLPLTMASSSALADGNWYHDIAGTTLHYKPTSGVASSHTVERLGAGTAVIINGVSTDYITVRDLTFRTARGAFNWTDAASDGINYVTITNNVFKYCKEAIYITARNSQDNNYITVSNNTIQNCGRSIWICTIAATTEKENYLTVSNNIVTGSCLTGSNATEEWESWPNISIDEEIIAVHNINNSSIYGNILSGNADDGGIVIWNNAASTNDNNNVYANHISGLGGAGIIAFAASGNVAGNNKFYYNAVSACGQNGGGNGGIRLNTSDTLTNMVYNNTVYGCDSNFVLNSLPDYWILKNNVSISPINYHVDTNAVIGSTTLSYNYYYPTVGNVFDYNGTPTDWAGWKTATSQDTVGSAAADPLVLDAANGFFQLKTGSPCLDTGTSVSLTTDYGGSPVPPGSGVDMGAYERFTQSQMGGTAK